jgi:hypothetical protein
MADDPVASGPDPVATSEKQESNLRHQKALHHRTVAGDAGARCIDACRDAR